jgi:hypothetical protein
VWRIDPLLGKHLETNNETTAVDMQKRGIHASTTIVTVGNGVMQPVARQLNSWIAIMSIRLIIYIFQLENHWSDIDIFY